MLRSPTSSDEPLLELPSPPRRVRLKPVARDRVWLLRLFTLPFIAAGCFAVFSLFESPLVSVFGHDATGQIVDVHPYLRGADGRRFDVSFTYRPVDAIAEVGYGRIDTGGGSPPALHQSVPIRVVSIGTFHRAELRDSAAGVSGYVCGGLFIGVWCTGVGVFTAFAWLSPLIQKRLIRDGIAADGVITAKNERRGSRNVIREISYKFSIHNDETRYGTMSVSAAAYQRISAGQQFAVLYDPAKPLRSVLYAEADYEIIADRQLN